jgi:hypothetical protein
MEYLVHPVHFVAETDIARPTGESAVVVAGCAILDTVALFIKASLVVVQAASAQR